MHSLGHGSDNVFSDAPLIALQPRRIGNKQVRQPRAVMHMYPTYIKETIMNSNKSTAHPSNQTSKSSSDKQSDNLQKGNQQSGNQQSAGRQGGTHEQHVEAGRQSHKNDASRAGSSQQSGTAQGNQQSASGSGKQGGTHEQHVEAGRQSHKNDAKR